jgi:signal transduction histidine kinase
MFIHARIRMTPTWPRCLLSGALDDAAKADLVATILEESERLNRFIANLLDMTRLESRSIKPNTARHDIGEIVGSVLERARKILVQHRVVVDIAKDLPMLELDPVLFEQVLFNLLDNAAKYASPQTTVLIQSWQEGRPSSYRSSMRGAAFRLRSWIASSTNSIAPRSRIRFAPAPGLGLPSPAASLKP